MLLDRSWDTYYLFWTNNSLFLKGNLETKISGWRVNKSGMFFHPLRSRYFWVELGMAPLETKSHWTMNPRAFFENGPQLQATIDYGAWVELLIWQIWVKLVGLTGILIMPYYNTYKTGSYNPYTLNNQGFDSLLKLDNYIEHFSQGSVGKKIRDSLKQGSFYVRKCKKRRLLKTYGRKW